VEPFTERPFAGRPGKSPFTGSERRGHVPSPPPLAFTLRSSPVLGRLHLLPGPVQRGVNLDAACLAASHPASNRQEQQSTPSRLPSRPWTFRYVSYSSGPGPKRAITRDKISPVGSNTGLFWTGL